MYMKTDKLAYKAPIVDAIEKFQNLNLLASISGSAGIDDWEEGEEL